MNFEPIEFGDFNELLELYTKYINYGAGAVAEFSRAMNASDSFGFKCTEDGAIIGFVLYENILEYTGGRADFVDEVNADIGCERALTCAAIVVEEKYERHGICSRLMSCGTKEMKKRGFSYLLVDMWIYPDGRIPAEVLLRFAASYKLYGVIENFYKDCYKKEIYCPVCGQRCVCGAKIYLLKY